MTLPLPSLRLRGYNALEQMQRGEFVRVVLRAEEDGSALEMPKPSDFDTWTAYRSALGQRHQLALRSGKSKIEELANSLGLIAQSAYAVNAIAVEGKVGQVLELLKQMPVDDVVVDRPLHTVAGR